MSESPQVAVVMGSSSDRDVMEGAVEILDQFSVAHEVRVVSAHRTPDDMLAYGHAAAERGLRVLIAGAGGAAHLPGMLAAVTTLPVIGVPVALRQLDGLDSLLSIVQMPRGVPVATVAVNGARNAGLLAVRILAVGQPALAEAMAGFQRDLARGAARAQNDELSQPAPTAVLNDGRGPGATVPDMPTLAEELGHRADTRLVIVTADDLGFCHSANVGVFACLATGLVTSATLMVPCPWAREAAARYRGEDIGVHLTVNAEHELYRWGPITHPPLLGGDGGFPRTMADVWDHADLDEVRRECRAQIERAILWGFDVSHLDAHMSTLALRPEFFDVYLEMAVEFGLPLRMLGPAAEEFLGFPARQVAADEGVVFTDEFLAVPGVGSRSLLDDLAGLAPGVTEIDLHPAVDSPELRAIATDAAARVDDYEMVCGDGTLRQALDHAGVTLIGFRELRDVARRR